MATRLGETLRKAALLDEAQAWVEAITPTLQAEIVRDWIQEDQLSRQGVDEDGEIIGLYSQATESITRGRKRAGDKFDLRDTGAFYRSMWVQVLRDSIIIDADSGKMENQIWWGDEILGLTNDNFEKMVFEIAENYVGYVRRVLAID